MRTQAQIEASRRNGAKSAGPVTPEGKARVSTNAVKHGLTSRRIVVLNNESVQAYDQLLADTIAEYRPETPLQHALVRDIVNSTWRLNRILALETAGLDHETDRQRQPGGVHPQDPDEATLTHRAVAALTPNTLLWYSRHEARLRRVIRDAQAQLLRINNKPASET